MSSDFYILGTPPDSLKIDVEINALNKSSLPLNSKVVLIPLNAKNKLSLAKFKSLNFENCIFIYLFKEDQNDDLNPWSSTFNSFKPSQILKPSIVNTEVLTEAIHLLRKKEQETSLKKMKEENVESSQNQQSEELLKLIALEKKLIRSQKKAQQNQVNESLNLNCLEAIFKSKSIGEIEEKITDILREPFGVDWVRILISPSDILTELPTVKFQNQFATRIFDLDSDKNISGKVIFASQKNVKPKVSENSLLQKICDAISLRIKQISTESDIENSKRQWEITFKALPFKAALIDKNYRVLEVGGLLNNSQLDEKATYCYKKFFNREQPCSGCKLGENFLVDQKNESLEVNSKEIFDPINDEHYYLNFYRDFEISTLGESGQATQTKLEELGIISGSIAHELNNPLGGIKILLELLTEDENLKSASEKEDLDVLMKSTKKCIDIVSELLNFTRAKNKSSEHNVKPLSSYFEQLKVFTQAYLLSEGLILQVVKGPHLEQLIHSPDSTLSIKLLEAVAHICKKINKDSLKSSQSIYLYSSEGPSGEFEITFSSILPQVLKPPKNKDLALSISPTAQAFDESTEVDKGQMLSLKFSTEVKLKGTHV